MTTPDFQGALPRWAKKVQGAVDDAGKQLFGNMGIPGKGQYDFIVLGFSGPSLRCLG
jgi:hypothetical protein